LLLLPFVCANRYRLRVHVEYMDLSSFFYHQCRDIKREMKWNERMMRLTSSKLKNCNFPGLSMKITFQSTFCIVWKWQTQFCLLIIAMRVLNSPSICDIDRQSKFSITDYLACTQTEINFNVDSIKSKWMKSVYVYHYLISSLWFATSSHLTSGRKHSWEHVIKFATLTR
jgi:hypothetical protein